MLLGQTTLIYRSDVTGAFPTPHTPSSTCDTLSAGAYPPHRCARNHATAKNSNAPAHRSIEAQAGRPLSDDEGQEERKNLLDLARLLLEWERKAHEQSSSTPPSEAAKKTTDNTCKSRRFGPDPDPVNSCVNTSNL